MASYKPGISRRRFIRDAATGVGAMAIGGRALAGEWAFAQSLLPDPAASGIEHIVVVMMETVRTITCWAGCRARTGGRRG